MWDNQGELGGPITDKLDSPSHKGIRTPDIEQLVKGGNQTVIGFFQLNKVRRSLTFNTSFFDIDILLVAPNDWSEEKKNESYKVMRQLQKDKKNIKCCMANDGYDIEQYLYGYVRLWYYDGDDSVAKATYPWYLWEGGTNG